MNVVFLGQYPSLMIRDGKAFDYHSIKVWDSEPKRVTLELALSDEGDICAVAQLRFASREEYSAWYEGGHHCPDLSDAEVAGAIERCLEDLFQDGFLRDVGEPLAELKGAKP